MGKEALRLSTVLAATPQVIYRAWFEASQHATFTKHSAKLDDYIGGKFSLRDGKITGRNMALEFGRRILQSWRSSEFPKGAPDSRLEIVFESVGAGTRMTVMHSDLPEGFSEPLRAFWLESYFAPMTDYFGRFATILANTPPSQAVLPFDDDEEEPEPEPAPEKAPKLSGKSKARAKARAAREARESARAQELERVERESRASKPSRGSGTKGSTKTLSGADSRAAAKSATSEKTRKAGKTSDAKRHVEPPKKATLRFPKDANAKAAKAAPSKPASSRSVSKASSAAKAKPSKPKSSTKADKKPGAAKKTAKKAAKAAPSKPAKTKKKA